MYYYIFSCIWREKNQTKKKITFLSRTFNIHTNIDIYTTITTNKSMNDTQKIDKLIK